MRMISVMFFVVMSANIWAQSGTKLKLIWNEQFKEYICYEVDRETEGKRYKQLQVLSKCRDELNIQTTFIIERHEIFEDLTCYEVDIKTQGKEYKSLQVMPKCRDELHIKTEFKIVDDKMFDELNCIEIDVETGGEKYLLLTVMSNCKHLVSNDTQMDHEDRVYVMEKNDYNQINNLKTVESQIMLEI